MSNLTAEKAARIASTARERKNEKEFGAELAQLLEQIYEGASTGESQLILHHKPAHWVVQTLRGRGFDVKIERIQQHMMPAAVYCRITW